MRAMALEQAGPDNRKKHLAPPGPPRAPRPPRPPLTTLVVVVLLVAGIRVQVQVMVPSNQLPFCCFTVWHVLCVGPLRCTALPLHCAR
jgi:hypothetical protein